MNDKSNALKVPKARLAVEMKLCGRDARKVELFVSDQRLHASQRKTVLELIEGPDHFVPAQDRETGEWLLVNREELSWVALAQPAGADSDTDEIELFDQRFFVRAELNDGTALDGELLFSSPATGRRVVDHLNRGERFFFLFQSDRVVAINKASVTAVVERPADEQTGAPGGED